MTVCHIADILESPAAQRLRHFVQARERVAPIEISLAGPNRVIARGAPAQEGDRLVVLVSDYPGWRLYVDDQPADVVPANGYLGAAMLPGEHTYAFIFQPALYVVGLAISLLALLIALTWILRPKHRRW